MTKKDLERFQDRFRRGEFVPTTEKMALMKFVLKLFDDVTALKRDNRNLAQTTLYQ